MRRLTGSCMTVAVLVLAVGCGKKEGTTGGGGTTTPSAPSIEGTYLLTSMEVGGKSFATEEELAKEPEAERLFKITPDTFIANKNGKEDPASYKVDTTKTPNEIDLVGKKADGKDDKMFGIYKLEGDKFTLCFTVSDNPADRPKEFKTVAKGGKTMLMTLKKK